MDGSDDKNKLIRQLLADLRKKLLDISPRNPLINFHFKDSSRTHIRVIDTLPDDLYKQLKNGKSLTFIAITKNEKVLTENSISYHSESQLGPTNLRLDDLLNTDKFHGPNKEQNTQQRSNTFRKTQKDNQPVIECAKQMGINPSFELPFPEKRRDDSKEILENKIQTLLFPDRMETNLSGLLSQIRIGLSEMGVNTLYCAWGFLEWYESDDSDTPMLAPLVLLALQMKRNLTRHTYRYSVESMGEDVEINLTLKERLRQDFGMELPSFTEADTPETYFDKIGEMIRDKPRWKVHRFITIGKFSFSRLVMYQDLDPNRWPASRSLLEHRIITDLLFGVDHEEHNVTEEFEVDNKEISKKVPILITDADSSQFLAIADAMTGKNLAIQGPPGTGKSQTITNIIASALYLNKKVLFLSEKMAALEVVKKRLDDAGLGQFCLELHSTKAQKLNVLDSLKKRLNFKAPFARYTGPNEEDREKLQDNLNEYALLMNQPYGELGKTITELIWAEQRAREKVLEYKAHDGIWQLEDLSVKSMTVVNLDERLSKLRDIEEIYYLIIGSFGSITKHPWYGINVANMSIFERDSMIRNLSDWLSIIKQIVETASKVSTLLEVPDNDLNIESSKNLVTKVQQNIPTNKSKVNLEVISKLHDQVTIEAIEKLIFDCRIYCKKYNDLSDYVVSPESACVMDTSKINQFTDRIAKFGLLDHLLELKLNEIVKFSETLKERAIKLQKCLDFLVEWRKLLGYEESLHAAELQSVLKCIKLLRSTTRETIIRRTKELTDELNTPVLKRYEELTRSCNNKIKELEKRFVINLKDDPQKLRQLSYIIRTAGILSRFDNKYKNAVKAYLMMLRPGNSKPKPSQMASDFSTIADILDDIRHLDDDIQLRNVVGPHYQGLYTDFSLLLKVNEYGTRVCKDFNANTKLGKCIRQFLLDEPVEVLDSFKTMTDKLNIDEIIHDVDGFALALSPKNIESICQEYAESTILIDFFYSYLSNLTFKDNLSILTIERIVGLIQEIQSVQVSISNNVLAIQALGNQFNGPKSTFDEIISTANIAKFIINTDFPKAFINKLLSVDFNQYCLELSDKAQELEKLISLENEIRSNILAIQRIDLNLLFGDCSFERINLQNVLNRIHKVINNPSEFSVWSQFCQLKQETIALGIGQLLDLYIKSEDVPVRLHLDDTYELIFFRSLIKQFFNDFPQYKQFSGINHESIRERFMKMDRVIIKRQRDILAQKLQNNYIPTGIGSGPKSTLTNKSLIINEIRKEHRHIPLRDLFMRANDAMLSMKPCFMMSPASVAQFIRPDSNLEFDLVIIDEASQMKPEEALGAIARGKQVIVVGDLKQLPPMKFFDRTDFPNEDDEDIEDYIDTESILDLALLTFRPSRLLNWHYRSRHESLIAFSNKNFYEQSLILFPTSKAKHQDLGIEYNFIKNGIYSAHVNVAEAKEVISKAREFMYKYPNKSLGIVTMNVYQMELLNAELEQLFSRDNRCEEYRKKWESTLEPLFAKNLENVQGDERDVIFISTLYGPNESGKVLQHFGPVNSVNGYRRLNVLFTRAKEKIVVFSSMKSTDIIPSNDSREGVKILKAYLSYAETGVLEGGIESNKPPDSDFEISVGRKLQQHGYEVVYQVGVAGYFIDLGVKNPNNTDNYILGIECDGRSYHSAKSARDRDRLRQEVLETMGWKIFRIWSLDWFRDQQGQMQRLLNYLKELCEVQSDIMTQDKINLEPHAETELKEEELTSINLQDSLIENSQNILEVLFENVDNPEPSISNEVKEDYEPFNLNEEAKSLEIILQKEKETPGTWRFKENKDDRPMTIYLTKEQVKQLGGPESIKVVITPA